MIFCIYYYKDLMRFYLLGLYILIINIDLGSLCILIFIIIILLKRKCIDSKFVGVMIVLLMYMTAHD